MSEQENIIKPELLFDNSISSLQATKTKRDVERPKEEARNDA